MGLSPRVQIPAGGRLSGGQDLAEGQGGSGQLWPCPHQHLRHELCGARWLCVKEGLGGAPRHRQRQSLPQALQHQRLWQQGLLLQLPGGRAQRDC